MLRSTYIHIPTVGVQTERNLWRQGALDWETLLEAPDRWIIPSGSRRLLLHGVHHSLDALSQGDYNYFAAHLPSGERWRAYPEFKHDMAYLDIETDGGTLITVIGVYDGTEVYQFVRGENLDEFPEFIQSYPMLVTFFGANFDLPMIQRNFPTLFFPQIHIDLCPTLRRLGLRGGLKRIEAQLGVIRDPDVVGLDGWAAVRLWNAYRRGNQDAMELLLRYNREDIVNLQWLMEYAYTHLRKQTGFPEFEIKMVKWSEKHG